MRKVALITFAVISVLCVAFWAQHTRAEEASLQMSIRSLDCNIDETYSADAPSYVITPHDCSEVPPVEEVITGIVSEPEAAAAATTAAQPLATTPSYNRSQTPQGPHKASILENTIFKPLASFMGFGSTTTSPARPVLMTSLFVGGASWLVDVTLLESRFSQAAMSIIRRKRS